MPESWLTVYGDSPSPLQDPAFLLDPFQVQSGVAVRLSQMLS